MARKSMREEILGAGVDLFLEKGFTAAGVKDITDRAGVPKGSFYNHFESKEVLATVALERYGESLHLMDLADRRIPPLERIHRHFEYLAGELSDFARGCMFGNFSAEVVGHSEPLRLRVKDGLDFWSGLLAKAIAEGQAAGDIRASLDPEKTALYLTNAWEGTILKMRADRNADAFDIFFSVTFDALLT